MRKQHKQHKQQPVPVKADKDLALRFLKEMGFKVDESTVRNREDWFSVLSAQGYGDTKRVIAKLVDAGLLKNLRFWRKRWSTDSYAEGYGLRYRGTRQMVWLSYPSMRSDKITIVLSNNYKH